MSINDLRESPRPGHGSKRDWWPCNSGDTVAGRVDRFEFKPGRSKWTVMVLASDDQQEIRVPVIHRVLKRKLEEQQVQIGDAVAICYKGMRTSRAGREYRHFRVEHDPLGPRDNALRIHADAHWDNQ